MASHTLSLPWLWAPEPSIPAAPSRVSSLEERIRGSPVADAVVLDLPALGNGLSDLPLDIRAHYRIHSIEQGLRNDASQLYQGFKQALLKRYEGIGMPVRVSQPLGMALYRAFQLEQRDDTYAEYERILDERLVEGRGTRGAIAETARSMGISYSAAYSRIAKARATHRAS